MRDVTSPVLVGRDAQLVELGRRAAAAADGTGGVVLVSGQAGAGKSRLVREALARQGGLRAVVGHCRAGGQQPYRPLAELVLGLARTGQLAPTPEVLAELVAVAGHPPAPLQVAAALSDWLVDSVPVALVLEDLHWADPETADVVATLAAHLVDLPVLLVATVRDDEYDAALLALRRQHGVSALDVPPLPDSQVREVATACLGGEPSGELVELLTERSEGIPLLVEELLASLLAAGQVVGGPDGWALSAVLGHPVPASLAAGVAARLEQLDARTREVLAAAALLGRSFDWRVLGPALGRSDAEVAAELDAGRRLALVESDPDEPGALRFRHALTADAVDAATFAPDRARLAGSLLAALQQREGGLGRDLVRAAQLARVAGHRSAAADLLVAAAKQAFDRSALRSAQRLLAEAEGLVDADDPAATRVGEELLRVLTLTGRMGAARQLAEALWPKVAGDDPDGRRRVEVALRLAKSATELGELGVAEVAVERAAANVRPEGELCHPSRVHLARAELAIAAGDETLAEAELASCLALTWPDDPARPLDEVGDVEAYARVARAGLLRTQGRCDEARAELDRAEHMTQVCDLPVIRARALAVGALLDLDELREPARLDEARRLALEGGATELSVRLDLLAAASAALGGQLATAAELASQASVAAERAELARHVEAAAALAQAVGELRRGDRVTDPGGGGLGRDLVRPLLRQQDSRAVQRRVAAAIPQQLARRGVTAREAEVAELVAAGLTNREIGGRLFVSVRTVDKHVERLLTKLDAPNRAALAAVVVGGGALRQGIIEE